MQGLLAVAQAPDVRQVAVGLDGVQEARWRLFAPVVEGALRWQAIERIVDLD